MVGERTHHGAVTAPLHAHDRAVVKHAVRQHAAEAHLGDPSLRADSAKFAGKAMGKTDRTTDFPRMRCRVVA